MRLQILGNLGLVRRIFLAFHARGEQSELIPFMLGVFPAHLIGIIIAIHINLPAFFPTLLTNRFVALFVIGSAAVRAPLGVTDVGGIKRVNDSGAVARPIVDTSAA